MRKMSDFGFCAFFGFVFVSYCSSNSKGLESKINVDYEWSVINFTWANTIDYNRAIYSKEYVPENNVISNVKIYDGFIYLSLPRMSDGTPVTLARLPLKNNYHRNVPLTPYPTWEMNARDKNCDSLQNVRGIEIDKFGIMWVLDGVRVKDLTNCPSKLVLLDLNNLGSVMDVFHFPESMCPTKGCFLYNVVVDDQDGGYAYITDNSLIDPGIIVYSRHKNRAWKVRDRSMFPEVKSSLVVDEMKIKIMAPIAGIALAPTPTYAKQDKFVYYSSLSGFNIYSLSAKILRNEQYCKSGLWRRNVKIVGKKPSQGDGMIMDNKGNLYLSLITKHGIGRWNIQDDIVEDENMIANDSEMFNWPDSFGFDSNGNLYVSVVSANKFYVPFPNNNEVQCKIIKIRTRTRSYIDS